MCNSLATDVLFIILENMVSFCHVFPAIIMAQVITDLGIGIRMIVDGTIIIVSSLHELGVDKLLN